MDEFIIEGDVLKKYTGNGGRVVVPEGIKVVGKNAFERSTLTEVVIPYGLERIEDSAFAGCKALTEITVPETVREIGGWAFADCTSLESAVIEGDCGTVPLYMFYGCSSLKDMRLPDGVSVIDGSVFAHCKSLKEIILPDGLTSLGGRAFFQCKALEYVYMPDSLESIGDEAFHECSSLKAVDIPRGVTELSGKIFSRCTSLVEINAVTDNRAFLSIDGNLYDKSGETLICYAKAKTEEEFYLPYHVKNIGENAFSFAKNLKRVFLHQGVKRIGGWAFYCSGITEIDIPRGVEYIHGMTFEGCVDLQNCYSPLHGGNRADDAAWRVEIFREAARHIGAVATEGGPMEFAIPYVAMGAYPAIRENNLSNLKPIPFLQLVYHDSIYSFAGQGVSGVFAAQYSNRVALYGLLPWDFSAISLNISQKI